MANKKLDYNSPSVPPPGEPEDLDFLLASILSKQNAPSDPVRAQDRYLIEADEAEQKASEHRLTQDQSNRNGNERITLQFALSRLRGVQKAGGGKYTAFCPAHDDRKKRSLSLSEPNGKLLLHCHAGCEFKEILSALGGIPSSSDAGGAKKPVTSPDHPVLRIGARTTYGYFDADGVCHREVHRIDHLDGSKSFHQTLYRRRKRVPLFCLKRLMEKPQEAVVVAEGEKAALALLDANVLATTPCGGANASKNAAWDVLKGRDVIIWPDNDAPGKKFAAKVLGLCEEAGASSVKALDVSRLPKKSDAADHASPRKFVEEAEEASIETLVPVKEPLLEGYEHQDAAEAFGHEHGEEFRWNNETHEWLCWNGSYWQRDRKNETRKKMREFNTNLKGTPKHTRRKQFLDGMEAMFILNKGIAVTSDELDLARDLLAYPGGVIDLRTGKSTEARREDLITRAAQIAPDFSASAPRFMKFMREIAPDHEEDKDGWIGHMQRYLGYCITGDIRERRTHFWVGTGENGKNTLVEVVQNILGYRLKDGLCCGLRPRDLELVGEGEHSTGIFAMKGRRLAIASEVKERFMNESLFKVLTGDELVTARGMRQDMESFARTSKILLLCNHLPQMKHINRAMKSRILIVKFTLDLKGDTKESRIDQRLPDMLKQEYQAIFAWLIEGARLYYEDGLGEIPKSIKADSESYFLQENQLGRWFSECCERDHKSFTQVRDLRSSFDAWQSEMGGGREVSPYDMSRWLKDEQGAEVDRHKGKHGYWNIRLTPDLG